MDDYSNHLVRIIRDGAGSEEPLKGLKIVVDAGNGELLYKYKSPHPDGSFRNAIAVDILTKRMYTTDGIYIMCMEVPE